MGVAKREIERTPFGQRLFEARTRAGLKQIPAAALIGISQSTLAELEKKGQGSAYTVVIAHVYKCDAHWLTTGEPAKDKAVVAREPTPPPAPPPRDFKDPLPPEAESDWGQLLTDLPFISREERRRIMLSIHDQAEENRRHLDEMVRQLKQATDRGGDEGDSS